MTYISACFGAGNLCFLSDIMASTDNVAHARALPRLGIGPETNGRYGVVAYAQKTVVLDRRVALAWSGLAEDMRILLRRAKPDLDRLRVDPERWIDANARDLADRNEFILATLGEGHSVELGQYGTDAEALPHDLTDWFGGSAATYVHNHMVGRVEGEFGIDGVLMQEPQYPLAHQARKAAKIIRGMLGTFNFTSARAGGWLEFTQVTAGGVFEKLPVLVSTWVAKGKRLSQGKVACSVYQDGNLHIYFFTPQSPIELVIVAPPLSTQLAEHSIAKLPEPLAPIMSGTWPITIDLIQDLDTGKVLFRWACFDPAPLIRFVRKNGKYEWAPDGDRLLALTEAIEGLRSKNG